LRPAASTLSPSCPDIIMLLVAIVDAVGEHPEDKTQSPLTLNTYVSAVKLGNFTHRRVMNQLQEVLSGSVVSA